VTAYCLGTFATPEDFEELTEILINPAAQKRKKEVIQFVQSDGWHY